MSRRTFVNGKLQPLRKTARRPKKAKPSEVLTARQRSLWLFSVFASSGGGFQGYLRVAADTAEEAEQAALHACVHLGQVSQAIVYPSLPLLLDETVWDLERKVTDGR